MMNKLFVYTVLTIVSSFIIFTTGCTGNENEVYISESGTLETTDVILSSQSNGNIMEIYFDEGNKISKGDTILAIDHSLLKIQLKQAIGAENSAEAQLNLLNNGARKEDLFLARQNLNQSKAALDLAKKNEGRFKKLLVSNSITQKQYDEVKTNLDIVMAKYKSAEATLRKLHNFARPEELKKAKAIFNQTSAQVEFIKKQINDSFIISPINGILIEKYIEKGELALPATSLVKISNLSSISMYIYVSERDMGKIKVGDKAEITVDSYPGKIFNGKISFISPEAEFTPKTIQTKEERTKLVFKVKISVPNPDYELKSGMPADAVVMVAG